MAFQADEFWAYGGQLLCSEPNKIPIALGVGPSKIVGSSYIQGPAMVGSPNTFPNVYATMMIGPPAHSGPQPVIPGALCYGVNNPYSLAVSGPSALLGPVDTNGNISAGGNVQAQSDVLANCGGVSLIETNAIAKSKKGFDIPHPSKEGWRLRHICPEGPSSDVYFRGRVTNKKEIQLPSYWEELVDPTTITVNLTPIGAHQNVIVKRIADNKIYLQANGGMPINCFFHIYGTRADGERLIPEYEGTSPADYPGDNSGYSIVSYTYDIPSGEQ